MPPPDPPGNKPAGSRSPRKNDRPHMPHVCPGLALSSGSEDLHGSLLSFSAPCFVRCAAKLACLAVLRCTLLEVLPACAATETQQIAWQGRAAIWLVLVPNIGPAPRA